MKHLLPFLLSLLLAFSTHAQWVKQDLPEVQGSTIHMGYSGIAPDKSTAWLATYDFVPNPDAVAPVEYVRTTDGGKTYQSGIILPDNDEYWYHLIPQDAQTAYLLTAFHFGPPYGILKTSDGGANWTALDFVPETWPALLHFYDDMNGIYAGDPDEKGPYLAYTTDGGKTFTRLPDTNYPANNPPAEFFFAGSFLLTHNAVFLTAFDPESGNERIWYSRDRGRNWSAGEGFPSNILATPFAFTDEQNGLRFQNPGFEEDQAAYFTNNSGMTWQQAGPLPGIAAGGNISVVKGTNNFVAIFQDTTKGILFTAATNDYGLTWHSRRDLWPYTFDNTYEPFGLPPFVWTNLEVLDNRTAWGKFSRTELHRWDGPETLVSENPDLELTLSADSDGLPLYGYIKCTLTIRNRGISKATGIRTHWLPPYKRVDNGLEPLAYVSAYASKGHYNSWAGDWDIDELASGESATATFHLFVVKDNADVSMSAQITQSGQDDLDSSPANMEDQPAEDDEAQLILHKTPQNQFAGQPKRINTKNMLLYPNPVSEKLTITLPKAQEASWQVRILNNLGVELLKQSGEASQTQLEWDLGHLPNGQYHLEYQTDQTREIKPFVVYRN